MLKRVVSSVVSVACLLSATGAFAATNYEATKTEYYEGKIKVTSTISGENGDTATYLVYDKTVADVSGITGTDIVYVDQYKFTGSEAGSKWTFSYVTDNSNIGATIKVGNGATSADNAPNAIPGISYPVTVKCGETEWETTGTTDADETGWVKIPFSTTQSLVKSVKLNGTELDADKWFTGADALWIYNTSWNTTSNTVEVEAQNAVSDVKMNSMTYIAGEATGNPDGFTDPSIVAVATVTGSSENVGIILTQDKSKIEDFISTLSLDGESNTNTTNKIGIFPALGVNSQGQFAIRIYDDTTFTPGSTWYAVAYCKTTQEGTIGYSDNCMEITIPEAAE